MIFDKQLKVYDTGVFKRSYRRDIVNKEFVYVCTCCYLRRPRGDIGRKKIMAISRTYAIMIPYVRNHDPVRTQSLSRTYAIIISYVRNHYPVRTQSVSRTYAIIIPYVRNHDLVRTRSLSRTYVTIIPYVRNHYPLPTQSLYDTYAFISLCYRPKIITSLISLIWLRVRYHGYT